MADGGNSLSWFERLFQWLASLLSPKPVAPPVPPPTGPPPVPAPPPAVAPGDNWLGGKNYPFPKGLIMTRAPGSDKPIGIPWSQVTRWEPAFTDAAHEFGDVYGPLLIAAMSVVESRSNHYTTGATSGSRSQVITGKADARAIGIMQVILYYHAATLPSADGYTPTGNIRIASKLMAGWIKSEGSWEAAIKNKYHPGTDPVSHVTQDEYIRAVREMILEVKAGWPKPTPPPPPQTNPFPKPHIYDIRNAADAAKFGLSANEVAALLSYTFGPRPAGSRLWIVEHIQDGTTAGSLDWWIYGYNNGQKVQASANYMANKDGTLLRVIDSGSGPWTNGDVCSPTGQSAGLRAAGGNPNVHSLTFEAEGTPFVPYTTAQLGAILWLCADWMITRGIPLNDLLPHSSLNMCSRANCPGQQHYDVVRSNLAAHGFK